MNGHAGHPPATPDRPLQSVEHRLGAALSGDGFEPVFQPIVSLPDCAVIGHEALARWPTLGVGHAEVLAHAIATGRSNTLDRMCIDRAVDMAMSFGLSEGGTLFINTEPACAQQTTGPVEVTARVRGLFTLVVELTERKVLSHPRHLLQKAAAFRADGWLVALDDIGANPASLALLDIVSPDVVKLDVKAIHAAPARDRARTSSSVLAYVQRSGASVLAEGIETEEQVELALAMGATLGQGFLFGRPHRLLRALQGQWKAGAHGTMPSPAGTPFDIIKRTATLRIARKRPLVEMCRYLENQAINLADNPIVLTTLQRNQNFSATTKRLHSMLAANSPLVAVFGQDVDVELGSGIRGVPLMADDPLCSEWTFLTLGAHTAAALIACDLPTPHAPACDGDRRFQFAITYDRDLVTKVACNLLSRVV